MLFLKETNEGRQVGHVVFAGIFLTKQSKQVTVWRVRFVSMLCETFSECSPCAHLQNLLLLLYPLLLALQYY